MLEIHILFPHGLIVYLSYFKTSRINGHRPRSKNKRRRILLHATDSCRAFMKTIQFRRELPDSSGSKSVHGNRRYLGVLYSSINVLLELSSSSICTIYIS
jgi:hypothetical protein